jgi:hypothetical protein
VLESLQLHQTWVDWLCCHACLRLLEALRELVDDGRQIGIQRAADAVFGEVTAAIAARRRQIIRTA